MKSQRTMTRRQAKTSNMSRIQPAKNRACLPGCANAVTFSAACARLQKIALALLIAQTQ